MDGAWLARDTRSHGWRGVSKTSRSGVQLLWKLFARPSGNDSIGDAVRQVVRPLRNRRRRDSDGFGDLHIGGAQQFQSMVFSHAETLAHSHVGDKSAQLFR